MLDSIQDALNDLKKGKCIIVVDDEERENEGDLVALADRVTPEIINFMITYGKGLVCVPITKERAEELSLKPMVEDNTDRHQTAFTVSIDSIECTTGISAFERALTVRNITRSEKKASDFHRPGHIFPLIAVKGGVLRRAGHTEAAVDLARMCNAYPAGVICEVINNDGTMARLLDLKKFASKYGLKMISIEDIIDYRMSNEKLVTREVETTLLTKNGEFRLIGYSNKIDNEIHLALVKGNLKSDDLVLLRIHSECITGEIFHSYQCDCAQQLQKSIERIGKSKSGVIIYLRQEGRGIGLLNKLKAYNLQREGLDTVEANEKLGFPPDSRDYRIAVQMLKDLKVKRVQLLTNNPEKIKTLKKANFEVVERLPIEISPNKYNYDYLKTKREKMGHMINLTVDFNQKKEIRYR